MTTVHDHVPRKKMATYGKAARRRMPEYNLVSTASTSKLKSQAPELQSATETQKTGNSTSSSSISTALRPDLPRTRSASSPSPLADDYDVPESEDGVDLPSSKPQRLAITSSKQQAKAAAKAKTDIFDVPSSEDETLAVTPKPKKSIMKSIAHSGTKTISNDIARITLHDGSQRKRLNPSPSEEGPSKQPQVKKKFGISKTHAIKQVTKRLSPPVKGTKPTRPTVSGSQSRKIQDRSRTPQKLSPQPQRGISAPAYPSPSSQSREVEMMDIDSNRHSTSSKGAGLLSQLLEAEDETDMCEPSRDSNGVSLGHGASTIIGGRPLLKPAGVLKHSQKIRKLPRRRLIDLLAEQGDDDTDDSLEDDATHMIDSQSNHVSGMETPTRIESPFPEVPNPISSSSQVSQVAGSQIAGPRFIYGRERTMLAEKDFMTELELEMQPASYEAGGRRNRRGSIPVLPSLPSFHEMNEEEDGSSAAIRSVHELRQSGANNRFLDEVEDFIERIGSPTAGQLSMRRSGLLDLADKMKDKSFARQFRANGVEQRLFVHLGQETDIIAGFIMISLLMIILAEGTVPHIIPQLRRQGVTRLLIRLLNNQSDIVAVSKERKSNVSRVAQSLVAEHQEYLIQMAVWEGMEPQVITPRTIALKCLEKMVRQTRESGNSGDIFSRELTSHLFTILTTVSDESNWDLPKGRQAIDFHLALSALESHSITARTAQDDSIWINEFLPIIANNLEVALSRPVDEFGEVQLLILRLTLNVTNNNPKGADVFARPVLLGTMGQVVIAKFKKITRFLREEELSIVMDHLVLVLGVMINFAEWSSAAREALQSLEGRADDPFERMTQLFIDNQEKLSEADSVEESQKNVAFGYLSVLLGYFALLPAMSERLRARHPRKSSRALISSIEEFIGYHKTVDSIIAADPDGYNPHSGLTERLEMLVTSLRTFEPILK